MALTKGAWLHRLLVGMNSAMCHCGALRAAADMVWAGEVTRRRCGMWICPNEERQLSDLLLTNLLRCLQPLLFK